MALKKSKPNNILFSILGISPQILTETLYALMQQSPPFMPNKIIVLTSSIGAKQCKRGLFQIEGGWFNKLCKTYQLDIEFSEADILVTQDENGRPIEDIRTNKDNQAVANHITSIIQNITNDDSTALHVSIAGGRKTMGFYAGYALSMFGREQDALSHVLVQDKFEGEPSFYFPTPFSSVFVSKRSPLEYYDRKNAKVELVSLPFVRMRGAIDKKYFANLLDFDQMVKLLQQNVSSNSAGIVFDLAAQKLIANDIVIKLTDTNFIFYYWVCKRLKEGRRVSNSFSVAEASEYAVELYDCLDEVFIPGSDNHTTKTEEFDAKFKDGMKKRFVDDRKTEIKAIFISKLGVNADQFYIKTNLEHGLKVNTVELKPGDIRFK